MVKDDREEYGGQGMREGEDGCGQCVMFMATLWLSSSEILSEQVVMNSCFV